MHTAEEASELSELGMKIASYKCFQKQFAKSCQGFVREEIYNFYKDKTIPRFVNLGRRLRAEGCKLKAKN